MSTMEGIAKSIESSTASALVAQDERLSYAELLHRAKRVAEQLKARGAGPGTVVPIQEEPSVDAVVAIVGILLTGAAYAPLDVRLPAKTVGNIARLCGAPLCIGSSRSKLDGIQRVRVERLGVVSDDLKQFAPVVPSDTSYVIFTSGSTGSPKGVVVPHEAVEAYLGWSMEEYDLAGGIGAPLMTSLGFDLTVTSLLGPLLGGRQVQIFDHLRWPVQIASEPQVLTRASFLKLTPSQTNLLCDILEQEGSVCEVPRLVVGGEPLFVQAVERWRQFLPAAEIINEYGPSEATVGCCRFTVPAIGTGHEVAIGTPPPGVTLTIQASDETASTTQPPQSGELHIAGVQVATGYLRLPLDSGDETSVGSVSNFPSAARGRMYRSGDRVQRLQDGNLVFLGRIGREVKVNGFRVNLAALESCLNAYRGVINSAVSLDGEGQLAAVVMALDPRPSESQLVEHLRDSFPSYAIPASIRIQRKGSISERGKFYFPKEGM